MKADPSKKLKTVELLGSDEKIKWVQKKKELIIETPKVMPCKEAITFKLTF